MSSGTLRAFAEAVLPGLANDTTAGAPDIAAERYAEHYLGEERARRLVSLLEGSLSNFASADLASRAKVIRDLRRDPSSRPDIDAAVAAVVAAVYGSWSGRDERGDRTREPLGWALTRYPGPVRNRIVREGPYGR